MVARGLELGHHARQPGEIGQRRLIGLQRLAEGIELGLERRQIRRPAALGHGGQLLLQPAQPLVEGAELGIDGRHLLGQARDLRRKCGWRTGGRGLLQRCHLFLQRRELRRQVALIGGGSRQGADLLLQGLNSRVELGQARLQVRDEAADDGAGLPDGRQPGIFSGA